MGLHNLVNLLHGVGCVHFFFSIRCIWLQREKTPPNSTVTSPSFQSARNLEMHVHSVIFQPQGRGRNCGWPRGIQLCIYRAYLVRSWRPGSARFCKTQAGPRQNYKWVVTVPLFSPFLVLHFFITPILIISD